MKKVIYLLTTLLVNAGSKFLLRPLIHRVPPTVETAMQVFKPMERFGLGAIILMGN